MGSITNYRGRFAPSPTGKLHLGSLVAAIASYCEAQSKQGEWLVRIEDIDPPREVFGASQSILQTLDKLGFEFSSEIIYQNQRYDAYEKAIKKLQSLGVCYYCSCSRQQLKNTPIKEHKCRNNSLKPNESSIKIKVPEKIIQFNDLIQSKTSKNLYHDCGDFILKRKDSLYSYQIAVVVDDHFQGITDIIRGIDLIDSTPWQIYLMTLLNIKQPTYAHIPVLVNSQGQKLSKQTFAKEIDNENSLNILLKAYSYLNQTPFTRHPKNTKEFWNFAITHWQLNKIAKVSSIKV